jgi:acylphosphatase
MLKQVNVVYSGGVQGVGFRYTARSVAQGQKVAGFVKNLPNGSVQLVVEGEERAVQKVLAEIEELMSAYIGNVEKQWSEATGEFHGFEIRF